jgi:hypothetical protein
MKNKLEEHFTECVIINPAQFDFINKSSTLLACSQLVYNIQVHRDGGEFVFCIFVDLRKAFDCVNHSILLRKLRCAGIGNRNYEMFASSLNDRKQFIEMNSLSSMMLTIKSGIPQGSLIGLILFNVYVNDLFRLSLHGALQMYADDTVLTYHHTCYHRMYEMMNEDLVIILMIGFCGIHLPLMLRRLIILYFTTAGRRAAAL